MSTPCSVWRKAAPMLVLLVLGSGCAHLHYRDVEPGSFHGHLTIRWIGPDRFKFIQDPDHPFYFERSDGSRIEPRSMYTDGGSIPRSLRAIPEFSPWGYAPAFVIHDWLFLAHFCKDPVYGDYSLEESAWIMSEGIKTLMVTHTNLPVRKDAMYSMYNAVRSPIARARWENTPCPPSPDTPAASSSNAFFKAWNHKSKEEEGGRKKAQDS